jgi:hypothetical protein
LPSSRNARLWCGSRAGVAGRGRPGGWDCRVNTERCPGSRRCGIGTRTGRGKARILDELCAVTGWHRDHARKVLPKALVPRVVHPRGAAAVVRGADGSR